VVSEDKGSKAAFACQHPSPKVALEWGTTRHKDRKVLELEQFIEVKGWKAMGNKVTQQALLGVELLNPLEHESLNEEDQAVVEEQAQDLWRDEVPLEPKGRPSVTGNSTGKPSKKSNTKSGGGQQTLF
jgi:hypothetical protein